MTFSPMLALIKSASHKVMRILS